MHISFHGAARTVTGSQHLLRVNGHSLLLECGLYQGRRQEATIRNQTFPFEPASIEAVILSHAHIDHSGNLPNLVKQGYGGPIYATHVTAHLAEVMLLDSAHIQEGDAVFVNRKRAVRGEPPVEPLYTQADASRAARHLRSVGYNEPFEPIPGVAARLVEAGHILGSAAVALEIEEKGRKKRVWFSGDIGRCRLPIVRDLALPERPDHLIMECTYGDQSHAEPEAAYEQLREVLRRTIGRGGKVIVPAFAIGRTQELVYDIQQMIEKGEIPRIAVFVDSPLAVKASQVFMDHPEFFDAEAQAFMRSEGGRRALGFGLITYVQSVEESKAINDRREPMVIISASGMAETGRILHHLRHNIENPRNTVLIVSWQAPNTLGRRLAEGEKQVKIFGEIHERRAEVAAISGLSAHAGQDFLREYALAAGETVRNIFLVHGEPDAAGVFTEKLAEAGARQAHYPDLNETVEI